MPTETAFQPVAPEQWLHLADVFECANLPNEALNAATQALSGDARQRAQALRAIIHAHVALANASQPVDADAACGHIATATRLLPERLQALRDCGENARAEMEERVGLALFSWRDDAAVAALEAERDRRQNTPGPLLAEVELYLAIIWQNRGPASRGKAVTLLQTALTHAGAVPKLQANLLLRLMFDQTDEGDFATAAAIADRILALEISDGYRARVLIYRARLLGGLEKYAEGVADADAATQIYAAYRAGRPVVRGALQAATLLREAGLYEEESARLRYALHEAGQLNVAATGIRFGLGRALLAAGHPVEAAEMLRQALENELAAGLDPSDRAETCQALAEAYEAAGRHEEAATRYGQAAALAVEAGEPVEAAESLRHQSDILQCLNRPAEAEAAAAKARQVVLGETG